MNYIGTDGRTNAGRAQNNTWLAIVSGGRGEGGSNREYWRRVCSGVLWQVQIVGYNSDLYGNMTQAEQSSNGLVMLALLVKVRTYVSQSLASCFRLSNESTV